MPSPRQRQILDYVRTFRETHGFPPTHREICARFGWSSTNGVAQQLHALERKGLLEIEPGKSRGIRLIPRTEGR